MIKLTAIEKRLKKLGWYYGGTGGGCDGYFFDIDSQQNTHLLMTEKEDGLSVPTKKTDKVVIGIYGDVGNLSYDAVYMVCTLADILDGKITFNSLDANHLVNK